MLQVRQSHSCGVSAIFFQCCFIIETLLKIKTQVLMTLIFFVFFLEIISWKGASFFNGGFAFQMGGFIFNWESATWGVASILMGGFSKVIVGWGGHSRK